MVDATGGAGDPGGSGGGSGGGGGGGGDGRSSTSSIGEGDAPSRQTNPFMFDFEAHKDAGGTPDSASHATNPFETTFEAAEGEADSDVAHAFNPFLGPERDAAAKLNPFGTPPSEKKKKVPQKSCLKGSSAYGSGSQPGPRQPRRSIQWSQDPDEVRWYEKDDPEPEDWFNGW